MKWKWPPLRKLSEKILLAWPVRPKYARANVPYPLILEYILKVKLKLMLATPPPIRLPKFLSTPTTCPRGLRLRACPYRKNHHPSGRDQREWVFEVREVKSEIKKLSLFFKKCAQNEKKCFRKVKRKCFHSFSRSEKWNQNASRSRTRSENSREFVTILKKRDFWTDLFCENQIRFPSQCRPIFGSRSRTRSENENKILENSLVPALYREVSRCHSLLWRHDNIFHQLCLPGAGISTRAYE